MRQLGLLGSLLGLLMLGTTSLKANSAAQAIQTPGIQPGAKHPWTSLQPKDDPDSFYFGIVTDRTGGARQGVFQAALSKLNLLEPAFVVSVGDLIEGYTENAERLNQEWDEMEGFIEALTPPFFYTAGNHDMSNALMANTWQHRFGPSFYHFIYKDVLFLVLNSELFGMVEDPDRSVPGPWQQAQQMDFVRQVLNDQKGVRWTVVLVHQPLWDPGPNRKIHPDWVTVETLLGERNYTVFAGHYHQYTKAVRNNRKFITLATSGGVSQLRGPTWGEFDHIALVKMTASGPRISNLLLDGIVDENVSTIQTRRQLESLTQAIKSTSDKGNGELFKQSNFKVNITNPLSVPLSVDAQLARPAMFEVAGLRSLSIAPGASETVRLNLSAAKQTPYRDLSPAAVSWTLTAIDQQQRPLQVTTTTPVLPLTRHKIPKLGNTITVDGKLDDWKALDFRVNRQGDVALPEIDARDLSFRFGLGYDNVNLYLAVAVKDDIVHTDQERMARQQDALAVSIDTRPAAQRSINRPVVPAIIDGFYAGAVVQILALGNPEPDTFMPFLQTIGEEIDSAMVKTKTGYALEMAVPHAMLDDRAGKRWRDARIGIRAYDLDEDGGTVKVLHWQPYRYGNAPLAGTHAFYR